MQITKVHIAAGLLILAIANGGKDLKEAAVTKSANRQDKVAHRADIRARARLSAKAIDRAQAGCELVHKAVTGVESQWAEGHPVETPEGTTFPSGRFVCNRSGWTAVTAIDDDGNSVAVDVAIATRQDGNNNNVPDIEEFREVIRIGSQ